MTPKILRTLCAAMDAAGESIFLPNLGRSNAATPRRDGILNKNELTSVSALIAFVAYEQNGDEETVRRIAEAAFGVDDIKQVGQNNYDDLIRFLVDLRVDEILN